MEVVDGERSVSVGGARLRVLLIRLALDAGRPVSVESLAQALWPEGGPADRAHALQSLVSRLRRALPAALGVQGVPGGYRLDLAAEAVDALRFERLASEGGRAVRSGEAAVAVRLLREALGLWRGEALAEVAGEWFAAPVVARLEEVRLAAVEDRVAAELELGYEPSLMVSELGELVTAHPLRERLRILQVRVLHAAGRSAEALGAYEEFRRLVADELGADPSPELQQLHLAVLRGEYSGGQPVVERRRGNLRAALTSFVGRERELARIADRLKAGRLVTLVGPGGVGKSRLATTSSLGVQDQFAGGVWLVELAAVVEAGDVPLVIADALGLRSRAAWRRGAAPRVMWWSAWPKRCRLLERWSCWTTVSI